MINVHNLIKLDKYSKTIPLPHLTLMTRSFGVLGVISHYTDWQVSIRGNELDEISFTVNKYINNKINPIWDKIEDLKIVSLEHGGKFEIQVTYTDEKQTVKSVQGVSLETELGQVYLNDFHVNDEEDVDREDYKVTVLYDPEHKERSLLHRVLADKVPHWSIDGTRMTDYVVGEIDYGPERVNSINREFTVDGTTVYDFLTDEVSKKFNVVFRFDTDTRQFWCESLIEDEEQLCKTVGEDTMILVSKNKLGNEITINSNKDEVKNCFRVEGGDDYITSQVAVVNMTGTNYIYHFADFQLNDMSDELREAILSYNDWMATREEEYYGDNGLYVKYSEADEELYRLRDSMTPVIQIDPPADAQTQWTLLKEAIEDVNTNIGVYLTNSYDSELFQGVTNNVATMLEVWCDPRYKVEILDDPSPIYNPSPTPKIWKGIARVTKESDEQDYYPLDIDIEDNPDAYKFTAKIVSDDEDLTYTRQKVQIALAKGELSRVDENFLPSTPFYVNFDPSYEWDTNEKKEIHVDNYWYRPDNDELKKYEKNTSTNVFSWRMITGSEKTEIKEQLEDLIQYLRDWNLQQLQTFQIGYQTCQSVLMSGMAIKNDTSQPAGLPTHREIAEKLYDEYTRRLFLVNMVLDERTYQVNHQELLVENLYEQVLKFQKDSAFMSYLIDELGYTTQEADELYKQYRSYIREDNYQNSNFISTGIEDHKKLVDNAKELLTKAQDELKKACVLQRTVSVNLNNLLALPEFEPLYTKFEMFNYIRVRTDDEILKLRMIGVDYSGDSMESIEVTFSDQVETVDGSMSDLQSVLSQARSIATSYSATLEKAEQGSDARNLILETYRNGLNAANTMLKSSDDNEVTVSRAGIIAKRMDDQGFYGDKQLRIVGNGMYMTVDAWKSVEMAVGEILFTDPLTGDRSWKYGVIADALVGNLIVGQELVIGNESGSVRITGDGINISNGTITWNATGSTSATGVRIPALENALSVSTTTIGSDFIVSPKIGGGYLYLTSEDGINSIELNPSGGTIKNKDGRTTSGYIIRAHSDGNDVFSIDTLGNAIFRGTVYASAGEFTGTITASSGTIGGWSIDSSSIYKGNFKLSSSSLTLESYRIDGNTQYGTIVGSGYIQFFDGVYSNDTNDAIGYITTGTWQDSTPPVVGLTFNVPKNGKFISFGHRTGTSGNWSTPLVINYGLNPGNHTQEVLIYGNTYFGRNAYLDGDFYFNNNYYLRAWSTGSTPVGIGTNGTLCANTGLRVGVLHWSSYTASVHGSLYATNIRADAWGTGRSNSNYNHSLYGSLAVLDNYGDRATIFADLNGDVTGDVTGTADSAKYSIEAGMLVKSELSGYYCYISNSNNLVPVILTMNCGGPVNYWANVYAANGQIQPSDRNMKRSISNIKSAYENMFLKLNPVSYQFKDGDRTHIGFISQEVEEAMTEENLTDMDFAGFCRDLDQVVEKNKETGEEIITQKYNEDGTEKYRYAIRYSEFIALNTHMIQKLYKRVDELEERLSKYETI